MPSSVAHGLAAIALGTLFYPSERARLYATAAAGSVLLDIDALGRPFGLGDVGWLGGTAGSRTPFRSPPPLRQPR